MLAYDLDLYEDEIKDMEKDNNYVELQFGSSTWEIEFIFIGKSKKVSLLGYTHVKEKGVLLDYPEKHISTTNEGVIFPDCGLVKFSTLKARVKDNYTKEYN